MMTAFRCLQIKGGHSPGARPPFVPLGHRRCRGPGAPRARRPTRPLSPRQIKHEESLKRDVWGRYRSWGRITSGVLLSIIGAVQYGTSKVFSKIVPQFDAEGFRHSIHQVMATFGPTGKEVVMVVDRRASTARTRSHRPWPIGMHDFGCSACQPGAAITLIPWKASGAC
jgi:hypothetical protein